MIELMAKLDTEGMPCSQPMRKFEPFEGRVPASPAPPAPAAVPAPAVVPASQAQQALAAATAGFPKTKPQLHKQGSLQLRKMGSKQFASLEVEDDVEANLEHHPYILGFKPTKADSELYEQLCQTHIPETPNLRRWFYHV